jgi:hypothetical protein
MKSLTAAESSPIINASNILSKMVSNAIYIKSPRMMAERFMRYLRIRSIDTVITNADSTIIEAIIAIMVVDGIVKSGVIISYPHWFLLIFRYLCGNAYL